MRNDDDEVDDVSTDTAELVRLILRQKPTVDTSGDENAEFISVDLPVTNSSTTIDTRVTFENEEIYHCSSKICNDSVNNNTQQCCRLQLQKEQTSKDDNESVETVELVRRIRLPLQNPPCKTIQITSIVPSADYTTARCRNVKAIQSTNAVENIVKDNVKSTLSTEMKQVQHEAFSFKEEDNEFSVSEEMEDEFILPDQSDSTDSSCSDVDIEVCVSAPDNQQSQLSPVSIKSLNCRSAVENQPEYDLQQSDQACRTSTNERFQGSRIPIFLYECTETANIKNGAFGFEDENKISCKSIDATVQQTKLNFSENRNNESNLTVNSRGGHHQDTFQCKGDTSYGMVRQGLHSCPRSTIMFSPGVFSNPPNDVNHSVRHNQISSTMNDFDIENFSDDENYQAFGLRNDANSQIKSDQSIGVNTAQNNALKPSKGPLIHLSRLDNSHEKENDSTNLDTIEMSWKCRNQRQDSNSIPINSKSLANKNGQGTLCPLLSTFTQSTALHPRRIRDPTVRQKSVIKQHTNAISMNPFSRCSNGTSSSELITTSDIYHFEAEYDTASAWQRNDVFGGSGVGAGAYELRSQSQLLPHPKVHDNSTKDFSSNYGVEEESIVASTSRTKQWKQPSTKGSSHATNKVKGKPSNRRYSGKRGKWGWKKAKQGVKGKSNAINRNGRRQITEPWAGNGDDPQLRHVGGAEMSF
jgi:hypothetical protein